tara:strand:+ start:6569 stop:8986 length:2418 start_codon:yes stop_codon:yes gene_type:complete
MAKIPTRSIFPSQALSDIEKADLQYGLEVAKAVESEWFKKDSGSARYFANRDNFHRLRLYARGEQSIQKYKDELSINGDLSYLNLDWKPVPIIPKFVDIVVNGISERTYDIKAYSIDDLSTQKRTKYVEDMMSDMYARDFKSQIQEALGVNTFKTDPKNLPENDQELSLHMQLSYKQSNEIAQEQALSNIFDLNKYDLLKKRVDYDIAVVGMGCVKNSFNTAEGIKLEYVDPADIVYSYTDSPYFDDIYYVGEVRRVSIVDLKKQFPLLTNEDIEDIEGYGSGNSKLYNKSYTAESQDRNYVHVLYFEYKTFENQVYKIKQTASGADKAIQKTDNFDPPKDTRSRFEKVNRSIECLYEGAKIVGLEKMLKWQKAVNMTRPKSDITKVQMSYNIVAPRIYKGKPESLVSRMTSFADMIQITHLKLQQVLSRMVPDGVFLDADGIAEVDLGNGTNYNPQEALNMYFQTGSVIGRSMTQDGEFNNGRVPIQELRASGGNTKIASLINSYNYYLQMIRDVTGLNEARDGSQPDKNALVGLQKLAAANSNTATRHILQAGLYLTLKTAESVSLRISDVLEYANTKQSFIQSLGKFNVGTLDELYTLHLHDFGIFLDLAPDEEEKQLLENNIQMAIQQQQINLEDAIDVREVKNLKLANQLLKLRRKQKFQSDRQMQMENIQAQSQSNAQASQAAAAADIQKQQGIAESKVRIAQAQSQFDIAKLEREAAIKKELMEYEFQLNIQLKEAESSVIKNKEKYKEDRKDERTKIQASQQSELIDQRKSGAPPKNFESAGFDNLGGFGLEQFDPR